jgi:Sulfotransferase family
MYISSGALRSIFRRVDSGVRPTFFFHIPKCAGSSIWESIFDIYGFFNVYVVSTEREQANLRAMSPSRTRSYSALGGHGFLNNYQKLLDLSGHHKIALFRDPLDRLISEYNFIRRKKGHFLYDRVSRQSFPEFVSAGWRNTQVHLLTGNEDDLDGAIELVNSFFDDWAFMEDLPALTARLYSMAGRTPRPAKHKNRARLNGTGRIERSPELLELMAEHQGKDLQFFEYLKAVQATR